MYYTKVRMYTSFSHYLKRKLLAHNFLFFLLSSIRQLEVLPLTPLFFSSPFSSRTQIDGFQFHPSLPSSLFLCPCVIPPSDLRISMSPQSPADTARNYLEGGTNSHRKMLLKIRQGTNIKCGESHVRARTKFCVIFSLVT